MDVHDVGHIRRLIDQGEGPTVEFKREFTTAIGREMVGLANAGGGVVLVGIADDGTIVGVDDPKHIADRVMGLCRTNVKPPIIPEITTVEVDGRQILVISVAEGERKPYTANDICYVRAGATTRRARPEELRRLSFDAEYTAYERTPVAGTALHDLNLARLQDYIEYRAPGSIRINGVRVSDIAVSWGLARRMDDELVPTVAGLMLFGLEPQQVHPQWGLGAMRVSGVEITDPMGYMEEVGRGLLRIQREMRALGSEPPVFASTPARFTVTLPSRHKTLKLSG